MESVPWEDRWDEEEEEEVRERNKRQCGGGRRHLAQRPVAHCARHCHCHCRGGNRTWLPRIAVPLCTAPACGATPLLSINNFSSKFTEPLTRRRCMQQLRTTVVDLLSSPSFSLYFASSAHRLFPSHLGRSEHNCVAVCKVKSDDGWFWPVTFQGKTYPWYFRRQECLLITQAK